MKQLNSFLYIFYNALTSRSLFVKLLLITQINTLTIAQTPYFKNFTENDGLASSTVYFIYQDTRGFMWFATDAGVSRYNGYAFETYTTKNGLADNEIFQIFEDSRKRIWFLSFNGKISYWYNGRFYNSKNTPFLKALDSDSYFSYIIEDKNRNIWFGTRKSGIAKLSSANTIERLFPGTGVSFLLETTNGNIISNITYGIFDISNNCILKAANLNNKEDKIFRYVYTYIGNDKFIVSVNDILYSFDCKTLNQERIKFDRSFEKTINICLGKDRGKWICTRRGVFNLSNGKSTEYLHGEAVSYVLEDNEGNTWFSTLGNGIYFAPSLAMMNYTKNDGLPVNECYSLKTDSNNNLWIGHEYGWLTKMNNKISSFNFQKNIIPDRGRITSICETKNGMWISSDFGIAKLQNNKTPIEHGSVSEKCIIKQGNKIIYGGSLGLFIKTEQELNDFIEGNNFVNLPKSVRDKKKYELWESSYMPGRINKLYIDSKDKVWIGMNNGLRILNNDSIINLNKTYPQLNCRISGITESPDHTIWISTNGNGVFSLKNQKLKHIKEKDGLLSDICNSIETDKDNIIWVATNKGINKIWYSGGEQKIDYINFNNGLISNQINDICVKDDKVWAATPKGLGCFDKNLVNKSPPPFIHITNFAVLGENKKYSKRKSNSLTYKDNNIKIEYTGISYRHLNTPLLYRYQFNKNDTSWYYTTNTSIEFPQLNPGSYEFKVQARNNEGIWSTKSSSINFTIAAPFWQTFWFYFIIACLFITGVWLIFSLRFKSLEKKEVLLRTVTESKLKALRAQMDPHFIFNSLLALQGLVRKSADDAENYIIKFAKLMRLILDNSRSEYIPLTDEIETLKNYFELQQLRKINIFEYDIYIDPSIDCDNVCIPPMLAQPFIENALEHGIFNKTEKGIIHLRFRKIDSLIELEVEDNGIGLQKSMKKKEELKKVHKSLATTIIRERLGLLSRKKEESASLIMTDVKDASGETIGTKVTFRVPYLNQFI